MGYLGVVKQYPLIQDVKMIEPHLDSMFSNVAMNCYPITIMPYPSVGLRCKLQSAPNVMVSSFVHELASIISNAMGKRTFIVFNGSLVLPV